MVIGDVLFQTWSVYLLVLFRVGALILTMPIFGAPTVPPTVKAGLAMAFALCLAPAVKVDPALFPRDLPHFALLAVNEVMVGAIIGLYLQMLLTSVQVMGQLAGFQMGFAVANVIDPMSGEQISVLAQMTYLMAMLTFLSVGAHHWLFKAVADSFVLIPPGGLGMSQDLFDIMVRMGGNMFSLALRIGAPVIGAMLFAKTVMGILAKTVPQMNILIVGFPFDIMIGMTFFSITVAVMIKILVVTFENLGPDLAGLMKAM